MAFVGDIQDPFPKLGGYASVRNDPIINDAIELIVFTFDRLSRWSNSRSSCSWRFFCVFRDFPFRVFRVSHHRRQIIG